MISFRQFLENVENSLHSHYLKHDNPELTPEHILNKFDPEIKDEIKTVQSKNDGLKSTHIIHSVKGDGAEYTKERRQLHNSIVNHFLSPEAIKAASPEKGTKPKFVVLGGRGGSGKSAFTDGRIKEFDAKKFITIDSDKIKEKLPEYNGRNASQVHEESSDIAKKITDQVRRLKLNHIHDATLKTNKVEDDIIKSKKKGYSVEGHYMHVPREVSATRAVHRYLGKGKDQRKRLVPLDVILSNTDNEHNFDKLKKHFDKWSAYDNNVPKGEDPKLINRG